MSLPNTAPARCRSFHHVLIMAVTVKGRTIQCDRCAHPAGPKPMHDGCGWHITKEKARINGVATPPRA